jgi:predicted GIY-YIG superfamily endonuclease
MTSRTVKGNDPKESQSAGAWIVYIVQCADATLYTGITNNLERRLNQHNAGTASRYTRRRLPVVLIYHEAQPTRSAALKRELEIKKLSRTAKQRLINQGT